MVNNWKKNTLLLENKMSQALKDCTIYVVIQLRTAHLLSHIVELNAKIQNCYIKHM